MSNLFMVFDVESAGLHGEGFAVGYVVVNQDGAVMEDGQCCCEVPEVCTPDDRAWLEENVMPVLNDCYRQPTPYHVRQWFWERWHKWKSNGAQLVTDCGWPVEANFLSACIADAPGARRWNGPYPLLDLSSVLLAIGADPVGTFDRLPDEQPAHNPLNDARQSGRILVKALKDKSL